VVIGESRIAGFVVGVGVVVTGAVVLPATAPPVVVASAGGAAMARNVEQLRSVLRVRTRKATTSFVGLRG
jgi:hypothetical protein